MRLELIVRGLPCSRRRWGGSPDPASLVFLPAVSVIHVMERGHDVIQACRLKHAEPRLDRPPPEPVQRQILDLEVRIELPKAVNPVPVSLHVRQPCQPDVVGYEACPASGSDKKSARFSASASTSASSGPWINAVTCCWQAVMSALTSSRWKPA